MILSTTSTLEGRQVQQYLGLVFGDAVMGVNALKDLMGSFRDVFGGRSGTWERELGAGRDAALQGLVAQAQSLGADAVLGLSLDYETLGTNGGMLMVTARGTAVKLAGGGGAAQPGPWTR